VTQYTTLTATANADVGPTPYYIRIVSSETGVVASCGRGTTCSVAVTGPVWKNIHFGADIEDAAGNQVASTGFGGVWVTWHGAGYQSFSAAATTLAPGSTATLTSTSAYDIGPSPLYTELYDDTSGQYLINCGSGTTCAGQASHLETTTHVYRAYFSSFSTAYPPAGTQEIGPPLYVTWNANGYAIALSSPSYHVYTATTNVDVGPTPYYIEIFDATTGTLLATCASGTSCSVSANVNANLVAFITTLTQALALSGVQASSNVMRTFYNP
jgi:hypothetical protein